MVHVIVPLSLLWGVDVDLGMKMTEDLLIHLKTIYQGLMIKNNIDYPVLSEQAEDETAIMKMVQRLPKKDIIVGSCGLIGENHRCDSDCYLIVGNDDNIYAQNQEFFEKSVVTNMARVVIINPCMTVR